MKIRTLMITAAGLAALSVAACNRDAAETTDEGAMAPAADMAETPISENGAAMTGSGAADASAGSTSSGAAAGGSMSGAASSGSATTSSPSVGATGRVDSTIPADAPSRNTRETAAAPGSPNAGQDVPYAYSPTNPAVQAKK